ncbi:MAG: DUF6152 family protein [Pseudomonadota bacterium]
MSEKNRSWVYGIAAAAMGVAMPLLAHHSFAAYDMDKRIIVTGVVTRVNPDANHLQIFFARMNEERKNVEKDKDGNAIIWSIEMAGSAASAQDGISVNSFQPGTVFSAAVHPQRNGDPSGFREGPLFKCPANPESKAVPPKALPPKTGMHCDSVQGSTAFGQGKLPAPTN